MKRILIIEDDSKFAEKISLSLENSGYQTIIAHNSKQALEYIGNNKFDLFIHNLSEEDIKQLYDKELENLKKEVEIANKTMEFKQNFLAGMSQELRTPLSGIIGIAELLKKTELSKVQSNFIDMLIQASDNLKEILDQVLDYSRVEAGSDKLIKRNFVVNSFLNHAEKLSSILCKKPIEFEFTCDKAVPAILYGDENKISKIIDNLIVNAIQFTEKGKIALKISKEKSINDNEIIVKVEVSDTGIGIKSEKQKFLFQPFTHLHEVEPPDHQSIGMGLALCKELAELHGGKIGFETTYGKGSKFWFTFIAEMPVKEEVSIEEKPETAKTAHKKSLKILFAEDRNATKKIIELQLTSMGHEVTLASNGKEALEAFKPGVFDLIIMDIQMPVMDGVTATKTLREKYSELPPIVGLSAYVFEGDKEKYLSLGLDEYITKPAKEEDFEELINKLF